VVELLIGTPTEAAYETEDTSVTTASEHMHQMYALMREQLQAGFGKAKKRYDERVKSIKFSVGQLAWHFIPCMQKGLNRKWMLANKGPYRIVGRISDVNFVVKRSIKAKEEIVHIDRLTWYRGTIPPQWRNEIEHDTMLGSSNKVDLTDLLMTTTTEQLMA